MSGDGPLRFAGYAALFGRTDAGRDTIRAGAFARTLADRRDPLPLYWQHRSDLRIGWVETAAEDERGLRVVATIDNPFGAAGLALKRGTVPVQAAAPKTAANCSTSTCSRSAWSPTRCSTRRAST